jgi:Protein of unknown function (DUF1566)
MHISDLTNCAVVSVRKLFLLPIIFCSLLVVACSSSSPEAATINAEFSAMGIKGTISGQNINLDLSGLGNCATNIENMVIGVNAYGASISPDPRIARDYSKPVDFTLTTPDGTKAVYTVTVKGADCISAPAPAPIPTPTACTAAPIGSTGFSLVFKGCDANNVTTYYDKTECVRDNATGLIWEGKTADAAGLRYVHHSYTNYDDIESLQVQGDGLHYPTQTQIDANTNSIGYKNAVNASNLCGSGAWRMPTKDELLGIVKTSETPTIDNSWFPNTASWYYWTSSPYTGGTQYALTVSFDNGDVSYNDRGYRNAFNRIRLVRN